MTMLPFLLLFGIVLQGAGEKAQKDTKSTLESLKEELAKKRDAMDRLIRLRVRRNLLLPISEEEFLVFSRPLEGISREEFQSMMDKEASHTTKLQQRLLALKRGVFMRETTPYAAPSGIAPKKGSSGGRKKGKTGGRPEHSLASPKKHGPNELRDPVSGAVDHSLDLVRLPVEVKKQMVPFLPLPMAMDPLLAGRPLIATIEPTKKLEKRLRVLLEAGFPRSALVLVDKALKKERRSLRLHYLRARILESLGRLDEALGPRRPNPRWTTSPGAPESNPRPLKSPI